MQIDKGVQVLDKAQLGRKQLWRAVGMEHPGGVEE